MTNSEALRILLHAINSNDAQIMLDTSMQLHDAEKNGTEFNNFINRAWMRLTTKLEHLANTTKEKERRG